MIIWMDLTNTLTVWKSGVVGIVRTELEIARWWLNVEDPCIRFCRFDGIRYIEVPKRELSWLKQSESVADAYQDRFKIQNRSKGVSKSSIASACEGLKKAYSLSPSRLVRLASGIKCGIDGIFSEECGKIIKLNLAKAYHIIQRVRKLSSKRKQKVCSLTEKDSGDRPIFDQDDVLFSCGWMYSGKEGYIETIRSSGIDLKVVYLIYDIIIIKKGLSHLYTKLQNGFSEYIKWVSRNCDFVLYGGNTAKVDTENYLAVNGLRVPNGIAVKFGSNFYSNNQGISASPIKDLVGVPFIICVGSIEPRKNYKTLYNAYCILAQTQKHQDIPRLVIIGKNIDEFELVDQITSNPATKELIEILQPSDSELVWLYENCEFVLVPSLYEGWSLTLPEALNYKKPCLCSHVAPLMEVAGSVVKYIPPLDEKVWAEEILNFHQSKSLRDEYSEKVKNNWNGITWKECSLDILSKIRTNIPCAKTQIYYDLTLLVNSYLSKSYVSGILRTQLILARQISRLYPDLRFFSITNRFVEFYREDLPNILGNTPIDTAYELDKNRILSKIYGSSTQNSSPKITRWMLLKEAYWFITSAMPITLQKLAIKIYQKKKAAIRNKYFRTNNTTSLTIPFKAGDIILNTGFFDFTKVKEFEELHSLKKFKYVQLIYDFTPIIVPQTHTTETNDYYVHFLKHCRNLADHIVYGGHTAECDGIKFEKEKNLKHIPSSYIEFGSDIVAEENQEEVQNVRGINIKEPFILTVGSIEARKNHEILYRAYLQLLEKHQENLPKLIICGYPGWKTEDFLLRLDADTRFKNLIFHFSPTDTELKLLYQNCIFTVLPSLYEGWSLTLPESLNYKKFCIASDTPPLKEIGRNFIDYANPYSSTEWAEKIYFYANNKERLEEKEKFIQECWKPVTWTDCANKLLNQLLELDKN